MRGERLDGGRDEPLEGSAAEEAADPGRSPPEDPGRNPPGRNLGVSAGVGVFPKPGGALVSGAGAEAAAASCSLASFARASSSKRALSAFCSASFCCCSANSNSKFIFNHDSENRLDNCPCACFSRTTKKTNLFSPSLLPWPFPLPPL
jgi:hypothetical protein